MKKTYKLTLHYGDPAEQVGISWGQTFVFTLTARVLILREQLSLIICPAVANSYHHKLELVR